MATWEDYYVLKEKFPTAPAWGPVGTQGGGIVTVDGKTGLVVSLIMGCNFQHGPWAVIGHV